MITIDEEFRDLIPPLTPLERAGLESNLIDAGRARNALVVWAVDGKQILLDGHNRYEICTEHDLPYKVEELQFDSREDAKEWILREQLWRRNLDPVVSSELRGRLYNSRKAGRGGDRKSKGQNVTLNAAEQVAAETGVDARTIKRDGQFAEAIDKVRPLVNDIQDKLRSHQVSKAQVISAACVAETEPERVREQLEAAPTTRAKRDRVDMWLCIVPGGMPLEVSEVAVNKSDPSEPITGWFVFESAEAATDEGQKHYDDEDIRAMTVADFCKGEVVL